MAESVRRVVTYRGRVQGVGFRYTTERLARGFPVVGYVKNLPEGDVRVVAEGAPAVVDAFLAAIEREMQDKIVSASVDRRKATGEYHDFHVEY